jgi:hypothetical protein
LKSEIPSTPRITASPSITKLTDAVSQGGLTDPGKAARPVVATSADQPHAVAVTLDANAKTVLLDFVEPFRAGGNLAFGGNAELKRLKHGQTYAVPRPRLPLINAQFGWAGAAPLRRSRCRHATGALRDDPHERLSRHGEM